MGNFKANDAGLYDMAGNVYQWCEDWYDDSHLTRVLRGSSWGSNGDTVQLSSFRLAAQLVERNPITGFRCVLAAEDDADKELAQKIDDTLAAANELQSAGKFSDARHQYEAALALDPASLKATTALAELDKAERAAAAAQTPSQSIAGATMETPWENSLTMRFVPVDGTRVLFSIWDTRVQDFQKFADATGYDAAGHTYSFETNGNITLRGASWKDPGFEQGPTHPVVGVSWNGAKAFCQWLTGKERKEGTIGPGQSYRLPTDAEWSIAVGLHEEGSGSPKDKSGKVKSIYPWGNQWPPPAGAGNYGDKTIGRNIIGLQSPATTMATPRHRLWEAFIRTTMDSTTWGSNVQEWCEDTYDHEPASRVLRGASWINYDAENLASSYRFGADPRYARITDGFRCVLARARPRTEVAAPDRQISLRSGEVAA